MENDFINGVDQLSSGDGLERLGLLLYGRDVLPREFIGGSNALVLHDAADEIERLRVELKKVKDSDGD